MDPFIAETIRDLETSPAGRLLAQYGFKPVHQGGGTVNYERQNPDQSVTVICATVGDGEGPTDLDESIQIYEREPGAQYDEPQDEWLGASVQEYGRFLDSLK